MVSFLSVLPAVGSATVQTNEFHGNLHVLSYNLH